MLVNSTAPVLVGYDGSAAARRAVHETAKLFGSRRALVLTVWEPTLPSEITVMPTTPGSEIALPPVVDVEEAEEIDETLQARAERIAEDGAELAKSLGLQAEPLIVANEGLDVADEMVDLAHERGVAAIVIGSRGPTGFRATLEGRTSRAVLKRASCPVVTVPDD
jgi:nucleotide-binding universal stress UspA family protein